MAMQLLVQPFNARALREGVGGGGGIRDETGRTSRKEPWPKSTCFDFIQSLLQRFIRTHWPLSVGVRGGFSGRLHARTKVRSIICLCVIYINLFNARRLQRLICVTMTLYGLYTLRTIISISSVAMDRASRRHRSKASIPSACIVDVESFGLYSTVHNDDSVVFFTRTRVGVYAIAFLRLCDFDGETKKKSRKIYKKQSSQTETKYIKQCGLDGF